MSSNSDVGTMIPSLGSKDLDGGFRRRITPQTPMSVLPGAWDERRTGIRLQGNFSLHCFTSDRCLSTVCKHMLPFLKPRVRTWKSAETQTESSFPATIFQGRAVSFRRVHDNSSFKCEGLSSAHPFPLSPATLPSLPPPINSSPMCLCLNMQYVGCGPLPVTVTFFITTTYVVGDSYKPSFATVTGRGPHPSNMYFFFFPFCWGVWKLVLLAI